MLEFLSANWIWILLIGGMLFMHLGHGGHGGGMGCGGHSHSGHREGHADGSAEGSSEGDRSRAAEFPRDHHDHGRFA